MKILYVLSTTQIGGVEKLVLRLGRALAGRHTIYAAVLNGPGPLYHDFRATFADMLNVWPHYAAARKRGDPPGHSILGSILRPWLETVDWVHVFNHFAAGEELAKKRPERVIQSVHFHPAAMAATWLAYLRLSQDRLRAVVVDSQAWLEHLPRGVHLPNFVDTDLFCFGPVRPRHGVLWVGKLNHTKGADRLVQIAGRSPLPFTVVDGVPNLPGGEQFRAELAAMAPRVALVRSADEIGMRDLYRSHSHLLFTSRFEGLPLSLLEGMASGMIPVATAVGGIPDVIGPSQENGFLYEGDDTAAACRLLETRSDAASAEARRTICRRFSQEVVLPRFCQLYEGVES